MITEDVFGYRPETKQNKKEKITRQANKIREQMIGYTDAIIERQDRYDILKRVESFDLETKTRKVLRELVEHFQG
jgi:hypothetical protein